ncbi:MAG TPA: hypothetical protein DCZ95_13035 [Verrucomicrobia bacterium]|nr:MAG: hypothetical protein A2X46_11625 [Lentisphaerae bacterium GWF2_57_35]HBA85012.1 hypothetical protein [Verrucomicrobiota bacterium]
MRSSTHAAYLFGGLLVACGVMGCGAGSSAFTSPDFYQPYPIWKAWLVLAGGLLLTLSIGYWIYRFSSREQLINRLVAERTSALQESEERFRTVLANLPGVVYRIQNDEAFTTLFVSDAIAELAGFPAADFLTGARHHLDIVHPDDQALVRQKVGEAAAIGNAFNLEYRVITREGEVRWVFDRGQGAFDASGRLRWLDGVQFDITERVKAESEMRRIYSAVEDYSDGVVLAGEKGQALYVNMAFGNLFKHNLESLQQAGLQSLFAKPEEASEIVRSLLNGAAWDGEVEMTTGTGEPCPILLRGAPTLDDRFNVVGFSCVFTDLTERKKLEGQLLHSQKMESVGHLAAGIAHEINTPIQFVGDNLKFLQEAFRDFLLLLAQYRELKSHLKEDSTTLLESLAQGEEKLDVEYLRREVPKALEQSLDGMQRVSNIVRAMKEFSHPGETEKSSVDINHAIETTITIARNEWKYVAEIETRFDSSLPLVSCFPGDFNQVMLNLIVNSAQAIAEANKDKPGQKGRIVIATQADNAVVEIRISDNGTGIPEDVRSKIFSPFFTTKEVGKGTGQGLSLAYNIIVKKHHGDIRFETQVGQGTTFVIRIPMAAEEDGVTIS